jgi:cobalt/nickel transport system permease protein
MYGGAMPFWYVAVRRCRRGLSARLIPLLSVFAAFSFVIMMFNIPLPGGTTGHAVGVGIAAIVLGPWGSIVAISVALFIQALLFGDGGITTFGANCFNMAIAGSLASYVTYRLIAGRASLGSARRVAASAIAGYVAINTSALLASIEFGIQPMFFKNAAGAPIYAPYPLSVAVPAMMIGHLTLAGLAELVVTAGVVAYMDRAFPAVLGVRTSAATTRSSNEAWDAGQRIPRAVARLWIIVSIVLMLTPLGLLAAGSAWGEWSPGDFTDPAGRAQISAASGDQAPPAEPPEGLVRLSQLWTAPMSHYAPSFMRSAAFGYILSAMTGCGLILLASLSIGAVLKPRRLRSVLPTEEAAVPEGVGATEGVAVTEARTGGTTLRSGLAHQTGGVGRASKRKRARGFLERTTDGLLEAFEYSLYAETLANKNGLLQRIDPRIKVIGMFGLIVATAMARNISTILAILAVALAAAVVSQVPIRTLATRIWIASFVFTGALVLPAIFVTGGRVIARLPLLGWTITAQGVTAAAYLLARVETAATIAMLLVVSTAWPHLLKALRVLGVPALVVVVLSMTYRYSFLMLRTARDMFESRRSRTVGSLDGTERRRIAASSVGVLLAKTIGLGNEVYLAMVSRGFLGEAFSLDDFEIRLLDWTALVVFVLIGGLAVWFGRRG